LRKWMGALLMAAVLVGCSGGGGGGGGEQQARVGDDQVKKAVKSHLAENEQKDWIASQIKTETGIVMLDKALDTQEGQKIIAEAVKKAVIEVNGQQAIADSFGKMVESPKFKAQLQLIIRDLMQEMMMKGVQGQGGKAGQGGAQGSESGGGQGDEPGRGGDGGGQ
jgi:hypothetical protein